MRLPLLLLLLLPFSFAAGLGYEIVPVAAMIAVLIVGISYMFAQSSQNSQLEAWCRSEFKELIVAAITVSLVAGATMTQTGVSGILQPTTGYDSPSSLTAAVNAKFQGFENDLYKDYRHTIKVGNRLGMLASYSYTMTAGYIFYVGNMAGPYVGASGLMQSLAVLAGNLSVGIMVYKAMLMFMDFLFYVSGTLILPLGLALRFIPFTRKIGGMLIALALGGIFIYPLAMIIAAEIHTNIGVEHSKITPGDLDKLNLKLPSFLVELCTNEFIRIFTSLSEWGWWALLCFIFCIPYAAAFGVGYWVCVQPIAGICWNILSYPLYNGVQTALMISTSIAMVTSSQNIQNAFSGNIGEIYDIIMDKLVIPVSKAATVPIMEAVFVGALTIVGSRSLSAALGGEVAIAGLERLL